jgi:GNAT superfamily N-acetyltransferase
MPLTIRHATPADAALIAEMNARMAQETEGLMLDRGVLERGVAKVLADPSRGHYFLAERDGRGVGQTMVTFEWSDWRDGWFWWFSSVYVMAEARRQGVFRALFQHVIDAAREEGDVIGLRLYVERENGTAQQTYRSLGMTETCYNVLERCPL